MPRTSNPSARPGRNIGVPAPAPLQGFAAKPCPLPRPRLATLARGAALAALLALPAAAKALELVQEPMPVQTTRESQNIDSLKRFAQPEVRVERESAGTGISQPVKQDSPYRLGKKKLVQTPGELAALNAGWESLNAGEYQAALKSFDAAAASKDLLLSREATLGKAYALWRVGREPQAEALFKTLVEQDFRVPEVLPNLLLLLRKRGGAKAVEPYLQYLPEQDRDIWRK